MKKNRKSAFNICRLCTFLVWIMLITSLYGCSKDTEYILTTGFKPGEIFRINQTSCYEAEALVYLANIKNEYTKVYGVEIWSTSQNGISLSDNVKETVIARLAKIKVMTLMAEQMEIELDDKEKEKAKDAAEEYYSTLSKSEIEAMNDITVTMLYNMYCDYALADKVYQDLIKNVNPEISDDDARTIIVKQVVLYYSQTDENGKVTKLSEDGKQRQYDRAEAIRDMFVSGEKNFDELVSEYSEAGEETLYYQKNDIDPVFLDAAFSLATGEATAVIDGGDGYYILYCVNPNDSSRTEQTKASIISQMQQETFDKAYTAFENGLECYINEELLASLDYTLIMASDDDNFFDVYNKYFGQAK